MKKMCQFAAMLALLVFASAVQAAPGTGLLDDGGFENATGSSDISGSAWVLNANKPDGIDLAARFQTSGFARSDGAGGTGAGLWIRTFEGEQDPGDAAAEFTLTQSIAAPSAGDYTLTVDWARELGFLADTFGVTLSASPSGASTTVDLIAAVPVNGDNFNELLTSNGGPNVATLSLPGIAAAETLTVTAFMTGGVNDPLATAGVSAFLDNFVLTVVPEPTSAILLGMGTFGLLLRRRR